MLLDLYYEYFLYKDSIFGKAIFEVITMFKLFTGIILGIGMTILGIYGLATKSILGIIL